MAKTYPGRPVPEASASEHAADAREARRPRAPKRRSGRERRAAGEHSALGEWLIRGVPARIMVPRIWFIVSLAAVLAFGLLMVYSASSVEALSEHGSSTYFLWRQLGFIGIGAALAAGLSHAPLGIMRGNGIFVFWVFFVILLALVPFVGVESGGARRWIVLPAVGQLQPSELIKSVIVAGVAALCAAYYEEETLGTGQFLVKLAGFVVVPLLLIIAEPDLGSCIIIVATVLFMGFFAGISYKLMGITLLGGIAVVLIMTFSESYRLERLMTMFNPWLDPYGDGYQLTLAIMAFASGGIGGRGIGGSTMKYNYLPEAHNDFIFSIIGEELGFVLTALFIALFMSMCYAGFKIASESPTLQGRLIAYGAASMLMIQFFVNVFGILGLAPMTGKPIPFISYGGSSMIGSMALAGLIIRVSIESSLPGEHEARRAGFRVMGDAGVPGPSMPGTIEGSTAGMPRRRSASRAMGAQSEPSRRRGFSVVDGAAPGRRGPSSGRAGRGDAWLDDPRGAASRAWDDAGGTPRGRGDRRGMDGWDAPVRGRGGAPERGSYERVDLGRDATSRLRSSGVRVRDPRARYDGSSGRNGSDRPDRTPGKRGPYGR